jgi:hypothetical protein
MNTCAIIARQHDNVAQWVNLSLRANDNAPLTIRNKNQAMNPMELGCLDYEAIIARRLASHSVRSARLCERTYIFLALFFFFHVAKAFCTCADCCWTAI